MRNRLNLRLVQEREIPDRDVKKLCALHNAMDAVLKDEDLKGGEKLETILYLEYMMQVLWKFPEQHLHHTHYKRFNREETV